MKAVMRRIVVRGFLLCVLTVGYVDSGFATTVIMPSDAGLVAGARIIIIARVLSLSSSFNADHSDINTYVRLKVDEVLKGDLPGAEVVLREPGGRDGDTGSIVFGTPEFARGERVLLYLDSWPDGSLRVYQMFLGKFSITRDPATSRSIVTRGAGLGVDVAGPRPAGTVTDRLELSGYRRMIRKTLSANEQLCEEFAARYYAGTPLKPRPPEYMPGRRGQGIEPEFTLHPFRGRWFEPDSGQPVTYMLNPDQQPTPQVADDVVAAMNAWSTVNGSLLRVTLAGTTDMCLTPTTSTIYFDNCDSRNSPEPFCQGVLALGGFFADYSIKQTIGDFDVFKIKGAFISFNPYVVCALPSDCNLREIVTHEMGHTLGLGHSWQPGDPGLPTAEEQDATMFFSAHFDGRCASIRTDDINGIIFLYPGSSGVLQIANNATLTPGVIGAPYSLALTASGEAGPYSWTITPLKGLLPPGLSFSQAGVISGIPLVAGTFTFSVQVIDSSSHAAQKAVSVTINEAALTVATAALRPGIKGIPYSQQLLGAGGMPPYRWAVTSGQLPDGLSLDAGAGVLSGTPSVTGTFGITISVSDAASQVAPKTLQLLVVGTDSVPQITGARYKAAGGKLLVRGAHFDSGATLTVDGSTVSIVVQSDAAILCKGVSLAGGTHLVVVVNSNGVASSQFSLTLN
jgi:hypothetical protein